MNTKQLHLWQEEEEEASVSAGYMQAVEGEDFDYFAYYQSYIFEPANFNHFINQLKSLYYEKKEKF